MSTPSLLPPDPLSRRTALRAAGAGALLLGAGGALTGCRSAVSADDKAAGGPRRGGSVTIAINQDFTPALLFTQSGVSLQNRLIYNTLTRYDDELKPQPELATSWTYAADGKSITLKLRDDVTYHDGRPFTADDVIFAVRNLLKPERSAQLASTAKAVTGFEKRGDHEVVLKLAHPVSNLFDLFEFMIIADRHTVDEAVKGTKLNGTGPFRFVKWRPGTGLSLTRNDKYWIPGRPYLDKVELLVYTQPDALLSALRSGQAQLSYQVPGRQLSTVKDNSAFRIREYDTGSGAVYVGATVTKAPANDKDFRQAVAWAVDRDRVVAQALGGFGLASAVPWPRSSPAYSEANRTHYRHDPARARELLKSSGFSTKQTVPLGHPTTPLHVAIAEIVQYDLKQIGIKTELEPSDPAAFQTKLITGTMPTLWINSHSFSQVQPATLAVSAYPFNEAKNTSHFSSAEYTKVVQEVWRRKEADGAAANASYQQVSDVLLDEAFIIDLAVLDSVQVAAEKLHGPELTPFSYLNLDNAYLD
ncbi:ABC transporter substrate-binding protein [Streptomyces sp. NL15-2K]|uniref:ABC transporter substrate-binding protein n=1 Tax=Streptomyces sp. NL15-2K TaxID=376149 RepID=UPI000F563700|nr:MULTISPECIES: ABC transporter substrate-binding protein [Actinomycetes]WKX13742.1 ABC transporter substrate-binding protein [Kutzneria buriramensis]GCB44851.1 oligopeptide ABC transporter [Streptomyces sp. NL15-2K]